MVQGAHGEKVDQLTQSGHRQDGQQVFSGVPGVMAALGDHIGEDGQGQPAQDAQQMAAREEVVADVVQGHGNDGNDLQGVARKAISGCQ